MNDLVEQARAFFREDPERVNDVQVPGYDWSVAAQGYAATIVRHDLSEGEHPGSDARTDDDATRRADVVSVVLDEIDRLRARAEAAERRVAELEAAGDLVADSSGEFIGTIPYPDGSRQTDSMSRALAARGNWCAVRGGRR